jgi:hypothetical protein
LPRSSNDKRLIALVVDHAGRNCVVLGVSHCSFILFKLLGKPRRPQCWVAPGVMWGLECSLLLEPKNTPVQQDQRSTKQSKQRENEERGEEGKSNSSSGERQERTAGSKGRGTQTGEATARWVTDAAEDSTFIFPKTFPSPVTPDSVRRKGGNGRP